MDLIPHGLPHQFGPEDTIVERGDSWQIEVIHGVLAVNGRFVFDRLLVNGDLSFPGHVDLARLPKVLAVTGACDLSGCEKLSIMPDQMYVGGTLDLGGTSVRGLPDTLLVGGDLKIDGCQSITSLPSGVKFGGLSARNCRNLRSLAPSTVACCVDLSGSGIVRLPAGMHVLHDLSIVGCPNLESIAEGVTVGRFLRVSSCPRLFTLPKSIQPEAVTTDTIRVHRDFLIGPRLSDEQAAMMVGRKASACMPHHLLMNLEAMELEVLDVDPSCTRSTSEGHSWVKLAFEERKCRAREPRAPART